MLFEKEPNIFFKNAELDEYQQKAVKAGEKTIVVANAGSGKTFLLTQAIINHRYNNLNDRICAITYTRAARAEMEERLRIAGVNDVEVTTIHVWSRNMLEELAKKCKFHIRIMEQPQIMQILKIITEKVKVKVKPEILYSFITGNRKMDVTDNYLRTLNILEGQYIKYKEENGLYDFTDWPKYLLDKLNEYNEKITKIDALFVDELQDIDLIQSDLFKKVICDKKFMIGDPKQSIYLFRGSDPDIFDKMKDFNYCDLKYNYRSCQEIIDFASTVYNKCVYLVNGSNLLISDFHSSEPSDVECIRKDKGRVFIMTPFGYTEEILGNHSEEIEANKVLNFLMEQKQKPFILCRTNKQVKAIEELRYFNVSTIHQAKGLEYDNVILIDEPIKEDEDLNVAYVGMTRAKNNLFVVNFKYFYSLLQNSKWAGIKADFTQLI